MHKCMDDQLMDDTPKASRCSSVSLLASLYESTTKYLHFGNHEFQSGDDVSIHVLVLLENLSLRNLFPLFTLFTLFTPFFFLHPHETAPSSQPYIALMTEFQRTHLCTPPNRSHTRVPLGLQILAAGNKHAIAVAQTIGASFVRVENFVFAHVADEGLMPDAEAPELLRYRRLLGAEDVCIVADIKKKHSAHAITQDVSLAITAEAAVFFGADGVLITGKTTGDPADPTDVLAVKDFFAHNTRVARPIWIGSGVTPENLHNVFPNADAFIVGSYLKVDGWWENQLDHTRAKALVAAFKKLRDAAE
eukprot:TRINITY_DN126_c0_g1_i3.p1 TRINITY_DN126_c0_g1~~TRINITY_DN126_c0_g1_i3.p1  ORF type:complete len:305 (-),score=52.56 TRINITY_DN126_c0_g1_i3:248-1162(-)